MSPLAAFTPILAFCLSTATFLFAIQSPRKMRIYLSPFLMGSAIVSLCTCSYLPEFQGIPALWGLFQCIWMHDAMSLLFFESFELPLGITKERWIYAYKSWCDPQRRVDWVTLPQRMKDENVLPSQRVGFACNRLAKSMFCWILHWYAVAAIPGHFRLISKDFAPEREGYVKRLLFQHPGPPITARETEIRIFVSYYWIWISYLMLDTCHVILSIFFVAVLRIDGPQEWRPLFGSPLEAYSIGRFWSRFWHRLTTPACIASGHRITRNLLGMKAGSRSEKILVAFWTFLVSGLFHAISDWQAGDTTNPSKDIKFFLTSFVFVMVELQVAKLFKGLLSTHDSYGRMFHSAVVARLVGYAWVLCFFFWVSPKWQYAKLYAAVKDAEYLALLKALGL